MEVEGGDRFPHLSHRAALRGPVKSAVEEPHLRRVGQLISTESRQRGKERDGKDNFTLHLEGNYFVGVRREAYPRCFKTGPPVMRMNWYLDPYTYAVSIMDLCSELI